MRQFKFNEQAAIENTIRSGFVDKNNITKTIYMLAKYNYHVLGLDDKNNYKNILKYMTSNCDNIYEESIYKDIESCIKSCKKHKLATIDRVDITKSEMDVISSLVDIKQRKAMFVILSVAKYLNALNGHKYNALFSTNSEICKMARITIPADERDRFMQFAYDEGLLERHSWCDSTIKKLTFISEDPCDKVVLSLKEEDYKDLAYTYLAYITPVYFRRCVRCRRWMRIRKDGGRICTECKKDGVDIIDVPEYRQIICEDCGADVFVHKYNSKTTRCNECQSIRDMELNRPSSAARMKKMRNLSE